MIRELNPTEFDLIKPIMNQNGVDVPDPQIAIINGALDERGLLRGFSVAQMALHLEPIWVAPTERGTDLWEKLMAHQIENLKAKGASGDIFAFAPRAGIERLLEKRLGFERMGWDVMRRRLL